MLHNDFAALLITLALALLWLRLNNFTAQRGWVEARLSRKLIHIGTGPLFVACWLLFSDAPSARWLAALVPLAITLQFLAVGMGWLKDEAAVQSMSRSGQAAEILRGPLFYGLVFVLLTLIYWRTSPIGITALMLLCGGDGLADILGRRAPSRPLPWNPRKTFAGSFGMFVGGWSLALLMLALFSRVGLLPGPFILYILPTFAIAAVGMLVESLPTRDVDNLTVTAAAALLGHLLF
jgi:phytol kinase